MLRKTAVALALMLLCAGTAHAGSNLAVGWGWDRIEKSSGTQTFDVDELVIKYEHQFPFRSQDWVGLALQYGTSTDTKGLSIRYYGGDADQGTFLGVGLAAVLWDNADIPIFVEDTTLIGPEVLVEFGIPSDLPFLGGSGGQRALAFVRYLTRVQGDQGVSEVNVGIDLLVPVL